MTNDGQHSRRLTRPRQDRQLVIIIIPGQHETQYAVNNTIHVIINRNSSIIVDSNEIICMQYNPIVFAAAVVVDAMAYLCT